jgi:hypothetical protein
MWYVQGYPGLHSKILSQKKAAMCMWFTAKILATPGVEIRRTMVGDQSRQIV